MTDLLKKSRKLKSYIVKIRRELHACPELGFNEYATSKIIQRELKKINIPFKVTVKTGVVAILKGRLPGKVIAIRADMDALPVIEETGLSFTSNNSGIAHSCGHDAHMACALGLAKLLSGMKNSLKGSVKFLFQPNEEMGDLNLDGAKQMIKAGAMKKPIPDAVIGLHACPVLPAGAIQLNYGKVYANADIFEIKVKGVGGHASAPQNATDTILASAGIILNLQSIVARNVAPLNAAVISVTMVKGGETTNVMPPEVRLLGTVRTLENKTKGIVKRRMLEVIRSTSAAFGVTFDYIFTDGYPYFSNDKEMAGLVEAAGIKILGKANVKIAKQPSMGGENFGHFAKVAPGCFFNLGTADRKKKINYSLHHPKFDIDENALPVGTAVLAQACFDFLES